MKKLLKMKIYPWTVGLLLLAMLDSIVTSFSYHAGLTYQDVPENNLLIVRVMEWLNLSLDQAMFVRIIYLLPLVLFLNHRPVLNKIVFVLYIVIYAAFVGRI